MRTARFAVLLISSSALALAIRAETAAAPTSPANVEAPAPASEKPAAIPGEKKPEPSTSTAPAEPSSSTNSADGTLIENNPLIEHIQIAHGASAAEIASLLRLGRAKYDKADYDTAEIAFMQVLAERATPEEDHEALLGLARTYRKKPDFTKAVAVYERFVKDYANDPILPEVYLELGRTLRAIGAYKQAIARFYSVLNSTLKVADDSQDKYRQLARTAQYEIAETYFQTGDYKEANRFFSRLKLLDLAPEDRAMAAFKSVFALSLAGEDEKAIAGLQNFLALYPDDENVPEARYLLSVSLRRLGRNQESLRAALDLLREESARLQKNPQRWAYWQRKTGNQLANDFYQSGDFGDAMVIYQELARLSNEPAWRLPATYQLGLCYERLRRFDKARECYQTIVDQTKKPDGAAPANGNELTDLSDMAAWRLTQLDWELGTDNQLSSLFYSPHPHPSATTAVPLNAAKVADDHDLHGNPANPPRALR